MQAEYATAASSLALRDEGATVVVVCVGPTWATFASEEPPPQR
jgi:hypothetical protein